jgi:signal transduction histidine kinase
VCISRERSVSPALVFVVPLAVTAVLACVTGLAYRHARRPYLLWWTGVWLVAVAFYLAYILAALSGPANADVFASFGLAASVLGWMRVVGFWAGARLLIDRRIGRRTWAAVAVVSVVWPLVVVGLLAGMPYTPALTRLSYAGWFFLGALELLPRRPRTTVSLFCGSVLLLMGIQGVVAAQLVLDLAGSMMSSWIHTALSLALGLGVLGRLLEEEREAAAAHSRELAAANMRLAELDQLKTDFVSMVSHELRTPLGLIKGYTGSLLEPDLLPDEATRREFLTVIDEETDRLTELVSNLLDMSRIEAGTLRVDPQPTELGRLLEASGARLRAREPGRRLTVDVPAELPKVLADERRIVQVVDNLLTNAARYSPAGAEIGLRARAVDGHVEVAVLDQGPGVPGDKRDQVFDKFVRLEGAGAQPGGTGLGLAICRGIVQAHGGAIWVESNADRGSTFAFSLPTARAANTA